MSEITPFVPITERVLDEEHKVSWRESWKNLVLMPRSMFKSTIVTKGNIVGSAFNHLLRPGLKKDFLDAYKDLPAAPNIIIPKVPVPNTFIRDCKFYP